jgi:tRNA U34 5-methylaminomethyl-2-thiouridine-forming methyltransferase MnmC
LKVIETKDGSSSIYLEDLDEHYHSPRGAISESEHVFIEAGLNQIDKPKIKILEVGFGTGLNALLTLQRANSKIVYHSLEAYPLSQEITSQINYGEILSGKDIFTQIHAETWDEEYKINYHSFAKYHTKLLEYNTDIKYNLVYYDAFAPSKQPEMWDIEPLKHIFEIMEEGGIFVTYCAAGQFKRNMKEIGFVLEKLPGANGKKEMTRARKEYS